MSHRKNFSKSKKIKILVCILGAGILAAVLFVFLMLQIYNPSGIYFANNVLLSPKTLSMLQDKTSKKNQSEMIVDRFEFSYPDKKEMSQKVVLSQELYVSFYDLVKNDTSVKNPDESIRSDFNRERLAVLTLHVNARNTHSQELMEVDFLQDYYRAQLMEKSLETKWVYFYHPGIYQTVINLFSGLQ